MLGRGHGQFPHGDTSFVRKEPKKGRHVYQVFGFLQFQYSLLFFE